MDFDILGYFADHDRKVFAETNDIALTYRQSLSIIKYLAANLAARGLFGKTVMLSVPHQIESHLLFLALLHTNNVILVHPEHNRVFLQLVCDQHKVDAIISNDGPLSWVPTITLRDVMGSLYLPLVPDVAWNQWYAGKVCLLSSGTTGVPKLTELQYQYIMPYGNLLQDWFPLQAKDRLYYMTPFYHGFGLTRLLSVIRSGSTMFVPSSSALRDLISDINQRACTWTSLVPRLVKIASRTGSRLWPGFRFATCSAAPINADMLSSFSDTTGKPIFVEYGCTEASIISSNTPDHNRAGSMGRIDLQHCCIKDGAIMVRPGYSSDHTWVDTGDVGWIDDDGFLWLKGRSKEVIKRNGRTVFPFEIECVLQDVPEIADVAAYSIQSMTDQEHIGLVYVGDLEAHDVEALCRQRLPNIYQPTRITRLPEIPLHCGKIRRGTLEQYVAAL